MKKIGTLRRKRSSEIPSSHVSIGFECVDRQLIRPEMCYDPIGESGIKWARVQTGWARTEQEKGAYDFGWLDDMVDQLLARGVEPWFNVGFGNPLYMRDITNPTAVGCVPLFYGEETLHAWKNFIRALGCHFRGRVRYYEIWNEANNAGFWYPEKPDGAKLAELVSLTGKIIREEVPGAKIGTCTDGGAREEYIQALFGALKPGELDFYCVHNYDRYPEHGPHAGHFRQAKEALRKAGHTQTALWMGEGGHASWHPLNHWEVREGGGSEHRQAVWQLRRFLLDLDEGTELSSFFQIADMRERVYETSTRAEKLPAAQGILNGKVYTPKKSYETISRLSVLLSGDIARTDAVTRVETESAEEVYTVSYLREGRPCFAYWQVIPLEEERPVRDTCRVVFSDDPASSRVLIDPLDGDVYEIAPGDALPLGEVPLIVCDRDQYEIDLL
ncbi:MAG: beta-galactosidase [Clostridia bacterium]|nr:beta-galactosidase [Clostridia bacterium]